MGHDMYKYFVHIVSMDYKQQPHHWGSPPNVGILLMMPQFFYVALSFDILSHDRKWSSTYI